MTEIIQAQNDDEGVLSAVLAEAFLDLPPSRWLIADEASRRKIFPAYFRIFVEHVLANGIVHTTPDRRRRPVDLGRRPAAPAVRAVRRAAAGGDHAMDDAVHRVDAALDSRHPAGTVHHHLALLGVWPGAQGRGIGTALLHAHHDVLDQAGIQAYLEASSHRNRRLYRRHGYIDLGPPICLPEGPQMFPMIRQPHPAATPIPAAQDAPAAAASSHGVIR